jgi:hypothetical protein
MGEGMPLREASGGAIDAYCVDCGQASVFQFISPAPFPRSESYFRTMEEERLAKGQFFLLTECCSRNELHKLFFCFLFKNNSVTVTVQTPSPESAYANDASVIYDARRPKPDGGPSGKKRSMEKAGD